MKEIILISSILVGCLIIFVLVKTIRIERKYNAELLRLNQQINEINSTIMLQSQEQTPLTAPQPQTVEESIQDQYNNYVEENFNNLTPELKENIDNLDEPRYQLI